MLGSVTTVVSGLCSRDVVSTTYATVLATCLVNWSVVSAVYDATVVAFSAAYLELI